MSKKNTKAAEERITGMEDILTRATAVMDKLEAALEEYKQIQPDIAMLEAYYTSPEWKEDLKLDEEGKLPKSLKRGVLSEDGIYDLLERYNNIIR